MTDEEKQKGRRGKPAHRRLVDSASKRLLNEVVGDDWINITLVKENPVDVKTQTEIQGERFGSHRVAMAEVRTYADVACSVVYSPQAGPFAGKDPIAPEFMEQAYKALDAGNMAKYHDLVRRAYGMTIYIIECEINPNSNLLRDGPRLTAYKLIKQQNNNLILILAVYEGTKVDNPQIFDHIWEFPRIKDQERDDEG